MAKMNQQQNQYLRQRVREVEQNSKSSIREKHTKPAQEPSDKEKLRILKHSWEEKPPVKKSVKSLDVKLANAFDWSDFLVDDTDEDAMEKELNKLESRIAEVQDVIMAYGPYEEALKLVQDIEKEYK